VVALKILILKLLKSNECTFEWAIEEKVFPPKFFRLWKIGPLNLVFAKQEMGKKYQIMLTFMNKNNPRSFDAHIRKLNMEVIHGFQFNGNDCYELALKTF